MSKRNSVIDLLRVVSIIGVMGNHLMYPVFSRGDFFRGSSWWVAFFTYTLSLVAVPIFIMISGYLLIDKTYSIKKSIQRTITRLIIPLIFWFGFYVVWTTWFRSAPISFMEIINFIFSGNIFIYYFLVILIGLYLLLPIFQLIAKHGSSKLHSLILYGSFFITWIAGFTNYFANLGGSTMSLTTWWLPFLSYFWWGFMFKKIKLVKTKRFFKLFIVCSIATLAIGYAGFWLRDIGITLAFKNGIFYWHDYLNPIIGLMSVGLFTWAMSSNWLRKIATNPVINWVVLTLAPLSYGAYLIHMFVINYIDLRHGYAIEFASDSLVGFITIRPVSVVVMSFAITFIISKIPYVRKLVGIA